MTCEQFKTVVYREFPMTDAEARASGRHLRACAECRTFNERYLAACASELAPDVFADCWRQAFERAERRLAKADPELGDPS